MYSSWYRTSSACVRTTDVTVVFPLGVWGAMGCSGGGMRIVAVGIYSLKLDAAGIKCRPPREELWACLRYRSNILPDNVGEGPPSS